MSNPPRTPKSHLEKLRQHLAAIERSEDPATIAHLEALGVAPGWHCLEVAAGSGSIARWLGERVGASGRVVATDVEVCLLREVDQPQLEIRRHDVTSADLETRAFDLVHARNLLTHIPSRDAALEKMAAAVRPGGWILIEEPDVVTDRADPALPVAMRDLYERVIEIIYRFARRHQVDPNYGAEVYGRLYALGFEELAAEGHTRMLRGDPDTTSPHQLAFGGLKDHLVTNDLISEQDFDDFMALYDNPAFAWRDGLRIATWGRRPASSQHRRHEPI